MRKLTHGLQNNWKLPRRLKDLTLKEKISQFLVSRSIYSRELPINYVWQSKKIEELFRSIELGLVDCGSRGDISPELRKISESINLISFDADPDSSDVGTKMKSRKTHNFFLGEENGTIPFNIYKRPWESSSLKPDENYVRYFSPASKIEKTLEVEARTLDAVIDEFHPNSSIDYMKLDVQGTELSILKGSKNVLEELIMLEVELSFVAQYNNQDLWFEIGKYLDQKGFEPLFLNRVTGNMQSKSKIARGQLLFGDMWFIKKRSEIALLSKDKKKKLILLLAYFGSIDLAENLFQECSDEFPELNLELRSIFTQSNSNFSIFWRRLIWLFIDRIFLFAYKLTRTNGLLFDSDRSHPYR